MIIIPSIDLLKGRCVRLYKGDYGSVTDYGDDPVAVARGFAAAGAVRIHVVDLDAARGDGDNRERIREIRRAVDCRIEVGGGIRSERDVGELLEAGADRLIVGTILARDPDTVKLWIDTYGGVIVAGIDADGGMVKVSGWRKGTGLADTDLAVTARGIGAVSIVYTSIQRDGTLSGPDLAGTIRVADAADLPVIVSGGVSSLGDVAAVRAAGHPRIAGIISGKAIYEGTLDLAEAIAEYQDDASRVLEF